LTRPNRSVFLSLGTVRRKTGSDEARQAWYERPAKYLHLTSRNCRTIFHLVFHRKFDYSASMARIYLVRHGKAGTTWDDRDPDPGLNDVGRAQAEARAAGLAGKGPLPVVCSPLRRTRETAAAFERLWNVSAAIEPRVGEISAPDNVVGHRVEWLKATLERRWHELDPPLQQWRQMVLEALLDINRDTVVVSHYVAINVAVGYATGDDRITCFRPENCSCTLLDVHSGSFKVLELGDQGAGRVL
jgi:broad specificity phosphatase PhoE